MCAYRLGPGPGELGELPLGPLGESPGLFPGVLLGELL
jgi:hypothetical protein